jgi:excisionase family DNA binding protein
MPDESSTPVFVRLPAAEADRLDRASHELKLSKRDLVTALVSRYLEPLAQETAAVSASARRVVVETGGPQLSVGRHEFRPAPAEAGEVLDVEQAAELLQVSAGVVRELAEAGELPGRNLGGEWRFSRAAVLRWLARESA